ncbi:helix-turn-helix domain-containing protein [Halomicrobium salinisoli]|uniref:helix-turn-helix domain-containing protein n=1 Tax=Halomicrobium salinisoli TaxID=2878391 RepID=UPI001CF093F7|nr:helix-turn-helix domain-containing protein [Halomicrobium salinisoli]
MSTIIEASVPADQVGLEETLAAVPDAEFEAVRTVDAGADEVMPLLIVRDGDPDRLLEAMHEDESVADVEQLDTLEGRSLFQVDWDARTRILLNVLFEGNNTVLRALARDGRWRLRVMYPRRECVSTTYDCCHAFGVNFEIETIHDLTSSTGRERYGLSAEQHEILERMLESGFYDIPRETTLQELAEEFDVSHQALSERIRRAHKTIIENAVSTDLEPELQI